MFCFWLQRFGPSNAWGAWPRLPMIFPAPWPPWGHTVGVVTPKPRFAPGAGAKPGALGCGVGGAGFLEAPPWPKYIATGTPPGWRCTSSATSTCSTAKGSTATPTGITRITPSALFSTPAPAWSWPGPWAGGLMCSTPTIGPPGWCRCICAPFTPTIPNSTPALR